jgi:hypothetical protein
LIRKEKKNNAMQLIQPCFLIKIPSWFTKLVYFVNTSIMSLQQRKAHQKSDEDLLESQAAPNKKGKGQRKGAVSNKIALLVVAAMLAAVYLYIEIKKGTNGTGFVAWIYFNYGRLDGYQKSGATFNSATEVLKSAASGTFIGSEGYNTDKMTRHNYSAYYDIVLQPYFNNQVSVMEVGVRKGGSLKLWRELFSFESNIWGIDISNNVPQFPKDAKMKVLIGSSTSDKDRKQLQATLKGEKFDIIVDDGDHNDWAQYLTFQLLGPLLKPTGVYIIEDNFVKDGRYGYYDHCGFDVSVHNDLSGEMLTILYPAQSIASRTGKGRVGPVHPRIKDWKQCTFNF